MAVYVVTGKLGAGKTLVAVGKIKDKLNQGCKVATNLDLNLDKLIGEKAKATRCYRIPDKPVLADLESIGTGTDSYDENKNGLLVLDECGTWFNARSWNDKSRQDVINWFLHARKLGWDIIFLIQDLSIMDKQARVALAEHVVYCRRMDRVAVPFIGSLYSLFVGSKMPMPKVHLGIVKYGDFDSFVMVDIPGLIEGASKGKGMGIRFLRHIERTSVLAILIDITDEDPDATVSTLLEELKNHNKVLLDRPRLLVFTKRDLLPAKAELPQLQNGETVSFISSVSGEGLSELVPQLAQLCHGD